MTLNLRHLVACIVLVGLSGCASNHGLYHWGNYEDALYQQQHSPEELEAYIEALTESINDNRKPIAPGLYAELGSAYLQSGDVKSAIQWYQKERDAWPESRQLMDSMISNLQRRLPQQDADKKEQSNANG